MTGGPKFGTVAAVELFKEALGSTEDAPEPVGVEIFWLGKVAEDGETMLVPPLWVLAQVALGEEAPTAAAAPGVKGGIGRSGAAA